jgi:TolB-like protein/thioredoxin-like negative regulator of GroEL
MKLCPECRRDYYDDTLLYCLDDGRPLLEGPGRAGSRAAAANEAATAVLSGRASIDSERTTVSLGGGPADNSNAVAVLPFANLSRNEDSEYFSDGLAEEILNVLSKISGLRVAARTSAFAFKGKQVSVKEIGRELDVASVLEGSVRMAGERVRIAVQLVNARDGYQLWSETYDRTMDDIFAIQDDIAKSVAGELRSHLVGTSPDPGGDIAAEMARAVKGRAVDPEAHRLMLLGRHLTRRFNEADLVQASKYFHQALEIDPDYAFCWCQLGHLYTIATSYGWVGLDTHYEKAEEALQRSLELEPDLAEAHARLGRIKWMRDGDMRGARESIDRGLELAPDDLDVLIVAGQMAREMGQFDRGAALHRQVAAMDPLNPMAWGSIAASSFFAGDLAAAELAARRAIDLAPQRIYIRALLALVLMAMGRADEALAEALHEPGAIWRHWSLAIIHHAARRKSESDHELAQLITECEHDGKFQIAEVHAMRGETDKAFEMLERSIEGRDPGRSFAKVSPLLRPLHNDPRWPGVLKEIGFPD